MYKPGSTRVGVEARPEAGVEARVEAKIGVQKMVGVGVEVSLPFVGAPKIFPASLSSPMKGELWQVHNSAI